jgi:predicted dehydrogenase
MADLHIAIPVRYRTPATELKSPTFSQAGTNPGRTPEQVDTEDFASVLVRFANGAHGSFTVSQISAGRKNRLQLEVDGARSALEWNSEDSERLWHGTRDRPAAFGQREGGHPLATLPAGHAEGWNDALRSTIAGFYDVVRGDDSPKPWVANWEDGWRAAALTEAILTSHRTRSWVTVPESGWAATG